MDLDLSFVSDDYIQCYKTAEGKPVHTNIDDELQLLPKETTSTPETGIKIEENSSAEPQPQQLWRRSQRLRLAKQTEKQGGVPCYIENNRRKTNNHCLLQESQSNQPAANNDEQSINRNIRTLLEKRCDNRKIRNYNQKPPQKTDFIRRGKCDVQRSSRQHRHNLRVVWYIVTNKLQLNADLFMFIYSFIVVVETTMLQSNKKYSANTILTLALAFLTMM